MITRSKKKKLEENEKKKLEENEKKKLEEKESHTEGRNNNNFDEIPLDLVKEVIGRFPVKSLARFLLVSKLWEMIIRSRYFIASYPLRFRWSQPCLLVAFIDIDRRQRGRQDWYLFSQSCSSSPTSPVTCVTCPIPNPEREYHSQYVNGLISLGFDQEQFIANPSTGKTIPLPSARIRTTVNEQLMGILSGYDSVNDQYKLLCMMTKTNQVRGRESPSTQHQVHTLGAEKKSWRMIKCSIPHRLCSNGHVCIDGVVYYVAKTGAGLLQMSLMRFDLRSEKLDRLTSLPAEIQPHHLPYRTGLINYEGKVAIPIKHSAYEFQVWFMDQYAENHEWLEKSFSVEPWKTSLSRGLEYLHIQGTSHGTGEFILAPRNYSDEYSVICYNPDTNSFRIVKVEVNEDYEFKRRGTRAIVFPNYVESARFLWERQFHGFD